MSSFRRPKYTFRCYFISLCRLVSVTIILKMYLLWLLTEWETYSSLQKALTLICKQRERGIVNLSSSSVQISTFWLDNASFACLILISLNLQNKNECLYQPGEVSCWYLISKICILFTWSVSPEEQQHNNAILRKQERYDRFTRISVDFSTVLKSYVCVNTAFIRINPNPRLHRDTDMLSV